MSTHDEKKSRARTGRAHAEDVNDVTLIGRLSQPAESRVLPSGSQLWTFRVIVGRPESAERRQSVDALDCVVWAKRPARTVSGWSGGETVEVKGSLRRRFFASAGGRASRTEVEVASARLIRRAAG